MMKSKRDKTSIWQSKHNNNNNKKNTITDLFRPNETAYHSHCSPQQSREAAATLDLVRQSNAYRPPRYHLSLFPVIIIQYERFDYTVTFVQHENMPIYVALTPLNPTFI